MDQGSLPNRRSIRLRAFDYAQHAAYFVTICCDRRRCLFGEIDEGCVLLTPVGEIAAGKWQDLPNHTSGLELDEWVVMPNHLHGIVVLPGSAVGNPPVAKSSRSPRSGSLGVVIGGFKSAVSREIGVAGLRFAHPIWQRNYFERVIRNDRELDAVRRYIVENPWRWNDDPERPLRDFKPTRR